MREYDFLLLYETKARELESICLLKYELERRGYSVAVLETWWCLRHYYWPVHAKVVVTLALYDDSMVYSAGRRGQNYKAIVNLQWEQIYSNIDEEQLDSPYHFHGKPRDMIHIAWGPFTVDKLVKICGVPAENVVLAGHMAMDFLKPRFRGFYMSREELLKSYQIDCSKKLVLFISSFGHVGAPDMLIENETYQGASLPQDEFKRLSTLSQAALLKWLKVVLLKHPECTFIYRPHPAEADNVRLIEMEKEIPNFRVIHDHSVKQWIIAADKIYSWYSTSVAEAYFCGKTFEVLRPLPLPHDVEIILYNDCRFITTMQEFERSINADNTVSPIKKETFERFYYFDNNTYSYMTVCDTLEKTLYEPRDRCEQIREQLNMPVLIRILRMPLSILKRAGLRFLGWVYTIGGFSQEKNSISKRAKYEAYFRQMIQDNYASKSEIQSVQERIRKIIASNTQKE